MAITDILRMISTVCRHPGVIQKLVDDRFQEQIIEFLLDTEQELFKIELIRIIRQIAT